MIMRDVRTGKYMEGINAGLKQKPDSTIRLEACGA
jgi:hypothetical protein